MATIDDGGKEARCVNPNKPSCGVRQASRDQDLFRRAEGTATGTTVSSDAIVVFCSETESLSRLTLFSLRTDVWREIWEPIFYTSRGQGARTSDVHKSFQLLELNGETLLRL